MAMERSVVNSGAALGAEVRGIDLSQPLSDENPDYVLSAWHENLVLLFRDQSLCDEDLLRLAECFGGAQVAGSRAYYVKGGYGAESGRVSQHPGISIVSNLDQSGNRFANTPARGASRSSGIPTIPMLNDRPRVACSTECRRR